MIDDYWGKFIIFNGWLQWVSMNGIACQAIGDENGLSCDMLGEIILCGPIYEGIE